MSDKEGELNIVTFIDELMKKAHEYLGFSNYK